MGLAWIPLEGKRGKVLETRLLRCRLGLLAALNARGSFTQSCMGARFRELVGIHLRVIGFSGVFPGARPVEGRSLPAVEACVPIENSARRAPVRRGWAPLERASERDVACGHVPAAGQAVKRSSGDHLMEGGIHVWLPPIGSRIEIILKAKQG